MVPAGPRELALYALVVAAAAVNLSWRGYLFSRQFERGGAWDGYAPGLRPGGLWGRSVDLSDIQWREFRAALPALAAVFAAFVAGSRLLARLAAAPRSAAAGKGGTAAATGFGSGKAGSAGDGCLQAAGGSGGARVAFYLAFASLFLGYLHGACAVFPVGLATLNFALSRWAAGRRGGAAAIWGFNIAALLAARLGDGFHFSKLSPALAGLDSHRGAVRWEISFNLSMLRMLSFALDLHWRALALRGGSGGSGGSGGGSTKAAPQAPPEPQLQHQQQQQQGAGAGDGKGGAAASKAKHAQRAPLPPAEAAARWRQAQPLPSLADYSHATYLAYVFYPPLYLAGSIMTFQDFAWQLRRRGGGGAPGRRQVLRYAARFAADWACLELFTHNLYFNSVAKHRVGLRYGPLGLRYGHLEIAMTGFWVLCFIWLKFATIWRFFRLAALLEGVEPPDNMRRCFANNYDIEGFWRGWHSSYNAWLVRYLYVPLGGSRRRLLAIWPVFFFVALWHDLELRLLAWAWLVCAAFVPELLVKRAGRAAAEAGWAGRPAYRHAAAALASLNIAALMAANLAGFVVGPDGLRELGAQLLAAPAFVAATLGVFFCAAQLMFAIRAAEASAAAAGAAVCAPDARAAPTAPQA